MSLHRALSELKTLDKRIHKQIDDSKFVGVKHKNKKVNLFQDEKEFIREAKADYQSIIDLITRKQKIKKAIVEANANTKVTVAGKEMTIADAIT